MQTDFMITRGDSESDEAAHAARVRVRQRQGFAMLAELRFELERQRDNGAPFSSAWDSACERALAEVRRLRDRHAWLKALTETRSQWRSAYQRQPDAKAARVAELEDAVA